VLVFVSGTSALNAIITASIVVPLLVLAIVVWLFFRAAKREDERNRV
jgi:hypothetical protein